MLASMTGYQFMEWQAFERLDPWGEERADIRNAHLIQTVIAIVGGKATIRECLYPFGEEPPPEPVVKDWRAIKAAGQQWADLLNARTPPPPEPEAIPMPTRRRRTR